MGRRGSTSARDGEQPRSRRGNLPNRRRLRFEPLENRWLLSVNFTGAYSQNFDSLVASGSSQPWANNSTLAGWSLFRQPAPGTAITAYSADDGGSASGGFYSFGDDGDDEEDIDPNDRALGGIGSGGPYFGSPASGITAGWMALSLQNGTATEIDSIYLEYTGEQWRNGGNATAQTMTLEYGFGSSFSAVAHWIAPGNNFDFTSPVHSSMAAALDGGDAENRVTGLGGELNDLNWAPGSTLWVRWRETNDVGNDHGLAIDDVTVSSPLATNYTVDALGDIDNGNYAAGDLTLREAVKLANFAPTDNTILFSEALSGQTIELSGTELTITRGVTIDAASLAQNVTIDANGLSQVFVINAPNVVPVTLAGLNLTGGQGALASPPAPLDDSGGAIRTKTDLTIIECVIDGNDGYLAGGGILAENAHVTIIDSIISNNSSSNGGGVFVLEGGDLTIVRSTIANNTATTGGGGILIIPNSFDEFGRLALIESTVSNNKTVGSNATGGGIFSVYLEMTRSTVSGNRTYGDSSEGAGIAAINMTISQSTITDNHAVGANSTGGGIYQLESFTASVDIDNSILIGNTATADGDDLVTIPESTVSINYSMIGVDVEPISGNHNVVTLSPLLSALGDFGGPTATHQLLADSPAIDAGDPSIAFDTENYDQRGTVFHRVANGRIDIGAYEVQAASVVVDIADDEFDGDYSAGDLSLREAVHLANVRLETSTIQFSPALSGQTITLINGELLLIDSLIVEGLGAELLTISGGGSSRVFNTNSYLSIEGVTLEAGFTSGHNAEPADNTYSGGAIRSTSYDGLKLENVVISDSHVHGDYADGGGVYAVGSLEVRSSHISGNTTRQVSGDGGGLFAGGLLVMSDSTVSGNATHGYAARGGGIFAGFWSIITSSTISGNSMLGNQSQGAGLMLVHNATLTNTVVSFNVASGNDHRGGGLFSEGELSINGGLVSNNQVSGTASQGGGVFANQDATIKGVLLVANSAQQHGGALYVNGRLRMTDSQVALNQAQLDGGGIWTNDFATILRSVISGNNSGRHGGGLYAATSGTAEFLISDSTISFNTAFGDAGGAWIDSGLVLIERSTVSDNVSQRDGGGMWVKGQLAFRESTVSGNAASSFGGGIFAFDFGLASLSIRECTIANNVSDDDFMGGETGGGIWAQGITMDLRSTLIADNRRRTSATSSVNDDAVASAIGNYNFVQSATGLSLVGDGNITGEPAMLAALADNGGLTWTHALLPGSPAINAGDPDFDPQPMFDQRGAPFARIVGGRVDIGAYEAQDNAPELPGDYNLDESIDAADYVLWRHTLDETNVPRYSGADGDGDTAIGPGDYDVWAENFGETNGGGAGNSSAASAASSLGSADPARTAEVRRVAFAGLGWDVTHRAGPQDRADPGNEPIDQSVEENAILAWLASRPTIDDFEDTDFGDANSSEVDEAHEAGIEFAFSIYEGDEVFPDIGGFGTE